MPDDAVERLLDSIFPTGHGHRRPTAYTGYGRASEMGPPPKEPSGFGRRRRADGEGEPHAKAS